MKKLIITVILMLVACASSITMGIVAYLSSTDNSTIIKTLTEQIAELEEQLQAEQGFDLEEFIEEYTLKHNNEKAEHESKIEELLEYLKELEAKLEELGKTEEDDDTDDEIRIQFTELTYVNFKYSIEELDDTDIFIFEQFRTVVGRGYVENNEIYLIMNSSQYIYKYTGDNIGWHSRNPSNGVISYVGGGRSVSFSFGTLVIQNKAAWDAIANDFDEFD